MEDRKKKKLYPMRFVPDVDAESSESWLLADLGYRDSEVENGWLSGSTLSEVLETYLEELVGEDVYSRFGRQFPLMVKCLTLTQMTPLMVCPDDEIAGQRYDTLGKMKFWFVMDAQPGARIYLGFKEDMPAKDLYERSLDGTLGDMLNVIRPKAGDAFLIPPGMVHAASKGLKIMEISECSDLDFRIWNWGRKLKPGQVAFTADSRARTQIVSDDIEQLSLEAAFDFLNMSRYDGKCLVKQSGKAGEPTDKIVDIREFTITKMNLKDALRINAGTTDSFLIYVCVRGAASLQVAGKNSVSDRYEMKAGEMVLVPAVVTEFFLVPEDRDSVILEACIEPYQEADEYIDPDAEDKLPEDDEQEPKMTLEEFLRAHKDDMRS